MLDSPSSDVVRSTIRYPDSKVRWPCRIVWGALGTGNEISNICAVAILVEVVGVDLVSWIFLCHNVMFYFTETFSSTTSIGHWLLCHYVICDIPHYNWRRKCKYCFMGGFRSLKLPCQFWASPRLLIIPRGSLLDWVYLCLSVLHSKQPQLSQQHNMDVRDGTSEKQPFDAGPLVDPGERTAVFRVLDSFR